MWKLIINPEYVAQLVAQGVICCERPPEHQNMVNRFYTINLHNFRTAISNVLHAYLTAKITDKDQDLSAADVASEVNHMVSLIRDACCTAVYARLRPVHLSVTEYANRYETPSVYTTDIELPLPLADAVQNFGPFNPTSIPENYYCVPVYPENTRNEGRESDGWCVCDYEAIVPRLKALGIPLKSVDCGIEYGTAWWCYKPKKVNNHSNLVCLYPPINYSEHSAFLASIFLLHNEDGTRCLSIIDMRDDDQDWPTRFRNIPNGFQRRSFSALCHDPPEHWI